MRAQCTSGPGERPDCLNLVIGHRLRPGAKTHKSQSPRGFHQPPRHVRGGLHQQITGKERPFLLHHPVRPLFPHPVDRQKGLKSFRLSGGEDAFSARGFTFRAYQQPGFNIRVLERSLRLPGKAAARPVPGLGFLTDRRMARIGYTILLLVILDWNLTPN